MSYIYITIPNGWVYTQRCINGVEKDVFAESSSENCIVIQDLVKDCLQHRNKQNKYSQQVSEQGYSLMFYYKSPPQTEEFFIKYLPNKNGKEPSVGTEVVRGKDVSQKNYSSSKYTGTLWFHQIPLSSAKTDKYTRKYAEQRDNRRHTGDSPKPT